MKKSFLFVIIVAVVMIFSGCENKPKNLILGNWKMIAFGVTEDALIYGDYLEGAYIEFKSDGIVWLHCQGCAYELQPIGKYKIDKKYFYSYDPDEAIFNYSFDRDKFKISNINPKFGGGKTYIANVFIFERIK